MQNGQCTVLTIRHIKNFTSDLNRFSQFQNVWLGILPLVFHLDSLNKQFSIEQ